MKSSAARLGQILLIVGAMGTLTPTAYAEGAGEQAAKRRAFFGELHLHTALSLDAWGYGTKLMPQDAYKFGKGGTVMVPAAQVAAEQGISSESAIPAKRAWPLDFMAVTDHSEGIGTARVLDDPASDFAKSEIGRKILANPSSAQSMKVASRRPGGAPLPEYMRDPRVMQDAWEKVIGAANDNYEPGTFTTFIGYEWSSAPGGKNLHRNVIFNADHAPPPFTADHSDKPEDLWSFLESVRQQGIDVIAIPHNGNASGGLMYDWNDSAGKPIDEAYAQRRATNEPLTEIVQIKGQSDTLPVLSPNDEFASFEIFDHLLGPAMVPSEPHGSYVREAFGRGLIIQSKVGANPFKYGLVAGSDIHNALSTSNESASAGGQFGIDPSSMLPRGDVAKRALGILMPTVSSEAGTALAKTNAQRIAVLERSSGGLTGVWAEENTRDAIFAALKRKETFATSGTRIRVRMFGGWDFSPALTKARNWVEQAYARGVPMGGDLPVRPKDASAPSFILQALKDPEGANLDRVQIIKVWLEGSEYREKIFDLAPSGKRPPGVAVLTTIWRDPAFDPSQAAVYYARVLETPTPRWSTLLANKNELPVPPERPSTIRERAWSSPIWYTPAPRVVRAP